MPKKTFPANTKLELLRSVPPNGINSDTLFNHISNLLNDENEFLALLDDFHRRNALGFEGTGYTPGCMIYRVVGYDLQIEKLEFLVKLEKEESKGTE